MLSYRQKCKRSGPPKVRQRKQQDSKRSRQPQWKAGDGPPSPTGPALKPKVPEEKIIISSFESNLCTEHGYGVFTAGRPNPDHARQRQLPNIAALLEVRRSAARRALVIRLRLRCYLHARETEPGQQRFKFDPDASFGRRVWISGAETGRDGGSAHGERRLGRCTVTSQVQENDQARLPTCRSRLNARTRDVLAFVEANKVVVTDMATLRPRQRRPEGDRRETEEHRRAARQAKARPTAFISGSARSSARPWPRCRSSTTTSARRSRRSMTR